MSDLENGKTFNLSCLKYILNKIKINLLVLD